MKINEFRAYEQFWLSLTKDQRECIIVFVDEFLESFVTNDGRVVIPYFDVDYERMNEVSNDN